VNAGEYLSIELDLMPQLVRQNRVFGYDIGLSIFQDFGTPERLRTALSLADEVTRIYAD
jgi:hypothetical protein